MTPFISIEETSIIYLLWLGKQGFVARKNKPNDVMGLSQLGDVDNRTGEGVECKDVYQRAAVWWKTLSGCIMLNVF